MLASRSTALSSRVLRATVFRRTMSSSVTLPVLIVGAGVSGLALAQSLKQHRIPFKLFERDGAADTRAQGYRIRISELAALKECLPPDVYDEFEATCGKNEKPVGRFDAFTGEKGPMMVRTGGPQSQDGNAPAGESRLSRYP